jgi:hypothetical protein
MTLDSMPPVAIESASPGHDFQIPGDRERLHQAVLVGFAAVGIVGQMITSSRYVATRRDPRSGSLGDPNGAGAAAENASRSRDSAMGGLEAGDSSVVARLMGVATAVGPEAQRGASGGDQRGHFHDVLDDHRQSVRLDDVAARHRPTRREAHKFVCR